jgi:hypothetical protein
MRDHSVDEPVGRLPDIADPAWDDRRARAVLERVRASSTPPRRRWMVPAAALACGAAALALYANPLRAPTQAPQVLVQPKAPTTVIRLRDGSRAEPLRDETALRLVRDEPHDATFELPKGGGRFEVVPNKARRFRVLAGEVSVQALGTVFTVDHLQAGRVRVAVVVGRVAVTWTGGGETLSQGQEGTFPRADEPRTAPPVAEPPTTERRPTTQRSDDWRSLARDGAFRRAYAAMTAPSARAVRDVPDELLLAADVARRAGYPEVAVRHLTRLLTAHAGDARAFVAAFTLGRVHDGQGQPAAAARAFEQAHLLDPNGALAQDALARAARAWHTAGDLPRARAAASRYVSRYPQGEHVQDLKTLIRSP